jgi:hypothetical protein
MSGPSFENIDRWLFEYVEGNLTPKQEEQLEAFIQEHPEFELDLDSWNGARVERVEYLFPNQEELFREEKEEKRRVVPFAIFAFGIIVPALAFLISYFNSNSKKELALHSQNSASVKKMNVHKVHKYPKSNTTITQNGNPTNRTIKNSSNSKVVENNSQLSQPFIPFDVNDSSTMWLTKNKFDAAVNKISHEPVDSVYKVQETLSLTEKNAPTSDTAILANDEIVNQTKEKSNELELIQKPKDNKEKSQRSISIIGKLKRLTSKLDDYMEQSIGLKNTRDHQFHVPGTSQLDANFSSAGDVSSTRFRALSRAQWISQSNQSLHNQMSLDWYSKSIKSGFGIQGNYQYYGNGVIQNWNTAFIYSPKILLSKSFLIEPAVRFKMGSKILNANKVNGINQVEINRENAIDFYPNGSTPIGTNLWYRDIGASILLHAKWFYAGFQMDNVLRHQDNIYSNNISNPRSTTYHYTINLGTEYESKSGDIVLAPYFYYQKFENLEESWGGVNFQYKSMALGSAISNKTNISLSIGLRLKTFALTYQFDNTYSEILGSKAYSHQVGMTINTKTSRSPRKYIRIK